jgi:hypothetical protein
MQLGLLDLIPLLVLLVLGLAAYNRTGGRTV